MFLYYLQAVLVLAIGLLSWNSDTLHRWAGGTIVCVFVTATVVSMTIGKGSDWAGIPLHRVLLDLTAFVIFLTLWLQANSWWVLWICSAQFLSVAAHLARLLEFPLPPLGYAVMEIWPFWFVIAVTLGSLLATRAKRPRSRSRP